MATAQELIDRIRDQLNDEDATAFRWPNDELLGYLNDSLRAIVTIKPESNIVEELVTITDASPLQSLPAGGVKFIKVTSNEDSRTPISVSPAVPEQETQPPEVDYVAASSGGDGQFTGPSLTAPTANWPADWLVIEDTINLPTVSELWGGAHPVGSEYVWFWVECEARLQNPRSGTEAGQLMFEFDYNPGSGSFFDSGNSPDVISSSGHQTQISRNNGGENEEFIYGTLTSDQWFRCRSAAILLTEGNEGVQGGGGIFPFDQRRFRIVGRLAGAGAGNAIQVRNIKVHTMEHAVAERGYNPPMLKADNTPFSYIISHDFRNPWLVFGQDFSVDPLENEVPGIAPGAWDGSEAFLPSSAGLDFDGAQFDPTVDDLDIWLTHSLYDPLGHNLEVYDIYVEFSIGDLTYTNKQVHLWESGRAPGVPDADGIHFNPVGGGAPAIPAGAKAARVRIACRNANTSPQDIQITGNGLMFSSPNWQTRLGGAGGGPTVSEDLLGKTGGIRYCEKDVLDTFYPDWWMSTPVDPNLVRYFQHFMHDKRDPTRFYLYPKPIAGTKVWVEFSKIPTAMAAVGSTYPLRTEFEPASIEYAIYRALTKEGRYSVASEATRQRLWGNFLGALGIKRKVDMEVSAGEEDNRPPGSSAS